MRNIFVITVTYTKPLEEVEKYLEDHREFLANGYKKGFLLLSGAQVPRVGGIIIGRFWSKEEAEAFIHKDPFFVAKVAEYNITEFVASKYAAEIGEMLCKD
ncbi:MAG: YciI family protein [Campylobacterales bacterium]|nr:YciI family protein [Campylobacterales bacterium]